MRWKFPDEADKRETRERARLIKTIEKWWRAFEKKADDCDALFHGRKRWDLPAFMHKYLAAVSPLLMWEFGPGEGDGHRLAITPEHRHHLRPLAEAVLERAPQLPGWSFGGYRVAESAEMALQSVTAKGGGDVSKVRVQARRGEHNRIDLTFSSPLFEEEDADDDFRDVLWLTEGLLGEEVFNRWVGIIKTVSGKGTGRTLPLDRVQDTVTALRQSIIDQLPDEPCGDWTDDTPFTQWEVRPNRDLDDYTAQSDLIVASSTRPDVWEAAHSGRHFWSGRFSRHGETFAYLKIQGDRRPAGEEAAYRQAIEDDVRAALVKAKVGSTIGGGSGLRYCYIDVALRNVAKAIPVLRKVIAKHDVPPQAWLLFHDDDWAAEWVALVKGAPAPLLAIEEE